jgi:hypothetical protein
VGHGFGVPSREEVKLAWARTRTSLANTPLAHRALARTGDYPLDGLPEVISAAAGWPIAPDTLLHDVSARIIGILERRG